MKKNNARFTQSFSSPSLPSLPDKMPEKKSVITRLESAANKTANGPTAQRPGRQVAMAGKSSVDRDFPSYKPPFFRV